MPGLAGAAPVHPQARARAVRHHALRADRLLDAARSRVGGRALRRDARPLVGHARPLLGRAPGRRGRAAGHPRRARASMSGMWNYFPMQFADHSILYILQETRRRRARARGGGAHLDRPGAAARVARPARSTSTASSPARASSAGSTRVVSRRARRRLQREVHAAAALLHRRSAPATAWTPTGGTACTRARSSCRGSRRSTTRSRRSASTASSTTSARFETQGRVGYGLHEHGFIGAFRKCGMKDGASGAP